MRCNDAHVEVDCVWCNTYDMIIFCCLHDSHTKPKEEMVIQIFFSQRSRDVVVDEGRC